MAAAPGEKSVLETIFEDGETLDDDGSLVEDVEMVDADALDDVGVGRPQDPSSDTARPAARGSDGGGGEGDGNAVVRGESQSGGRDGGKAHRRNRRKNKKKRRPPSDMRITDINRFVIDTCRHLKEKKSYLVWNAVGCLGVSAVSDLVKEVYAIQSHGGQKTADGRRFRCGGGILWNILKTRDPKAYKEIMAKGREFEKQFRQSKTTEAKKENETDVFSMGACETEESVEQELDGSQPTEEVPSVLAQHKFVGKGKSILSRIRTPVSYDDLFEEGEIV